MALLKFLIEVFKSSSIVSTRKLSKGVEVIIDPLVVSGDLVHSELMDIL